MDSRELYKLVSRDLTDYRNWRDNQKELSRLRLNDRSKTKKAYPSAPALSEPIIDDNVTSLTNAEVSIFWSARTVATFIPLTSDGYQFKRSAEMAFDTLLRITLKSRAKIENLFDVKNERGIGIAKFVLNDTAVKDSVLPDFEPVDPIDVVVPTITRDITNAERVTHIIRYSEREFREQGVKSGWRNIEEIIKRIITQVNPGETGDNLNDSGSDGRYGESRSKIVLNDDGSSSISQIVVWEVYHYERSNDGSYRRFVTTFCPDAAELLLKRIPWKWDNKLLQAEIPPQVLEDGTAVEGVAEQFVLGDDRPWPFVQFRFENRTLRHYDVRGAAEKLRHDQSFATANFRAKGIMMDYLAKPFLKGPSGSISNFHWRPGEKLPPDTELMIPPRVDPVFDFNMDLARAAAARRVGSTFGAFSSLDRSKEAKTATEVSLENRTAGALSSNNVERFAESLAAMFNMQWEWLRHNPTELPAIDNGKAVMTDNAIFEHDYIIVCGVSGRSANPDLVIRQLMAISQVLGVFPQAGQFIYGDKMAQFLFDQIDPKLTPNLVYEPDNQQQGGQMPIQMQLQQMMQGIQQIGQQMQQLGQVVQAHDDYISQDAEEELNREDAEKGNKVDETQAKTSLSEVR